MKKQTVRLGRTSFPVRASFLGVPATVTSPAFGLLFESQRARLLAQALSTLGYDGTAEAEDLVQETFLKALNKLAQLQNRDAFAGGCIQSCATCATSTSGAIAATSSRWRLP